MKGILISMRTQENENIVNNFLGKLDVLDETSLQNLVQKLGESKEAMIKFFENMITKKKNVHSGEYKPINWMFSYGISGNCIHLHLPMDLHQMITEIGISKTMYTVNLSLLDAIDRITRLRNEGFHKFQGKDSIYMISPILRGRELRFLDGLDFETVIYTKQQLSDKEFVKDNFEAMLAIHKFGQEQNIGTAKIKFDTILSRKWQEKKQQVEKDFKEKGITLQEDKRIEK